MKWRQWNEIFNPLMPDTGEMLPEVPTTKSSNINELNGHATNA